MPSKHQKIINYISSLEVGSKISVRGIANKLNVSEGTAYKAIRECDKLDIVKTIPRIGTVRIENLKRKNIKYLSYAEVINVIQGTLLGGKDGVHKALNKFLIGAMTEDAMTEYITPGCLLIIGNREKAQELALNSDSGVLITGGFNCSDNIKKLADEKCLPIISSKYDTFTVASMINKALSENMLKRDILLVEDIMEQCKHCLKPTDSVFEVKKLIRCTSKDSFPVLDNNNKVIGIITQKDLINKEDNEVIDKIMDKNPITFPTNTTVVYAAHIMGLEGVKICPIVQNRKLKGIITRKNVISALNHLHRKNQIMNSLDRIILENFEIDTNEKGMEFYGKIAPEMFDSSGTASWGSLNMLLSTIGVITIKNENNINVLVDSISSYFIKPVEIDTFIKICTNIIDNTRNICKVEVSMFNEKKELIAKGIISAKTLSKV